MLFYIIGLGLAYYYSKYYLPNTSNSKGIPKLDFTYKPFIYKGMIIIPFSDYKAIHLHHWIIYLFLIFILSYLYEIIIGICIGLTIQGLLYKDRFEFIVKNPYTNNKEQNKDSSKDTINNSNDKLSMVEVNQQEIFNGIYYLGKLFKSKKE